MHFSLVVITDGQPYNDEIEEIMEPYDKRLEVPHYITKEELIKDRREQMAWYKENIYSKYIADKEGYIANYMASFPQNPEHYIQFLETEFPKQLTWTDEECYQDVLKNLDPTTIQPDGSVFSTENPNTKWDWYEIGGRYAGLLYIPEVCRSFECDDEQEKLYLKSIDYPGYLDVDEAYLIDISRPDKADKEARASRIWDLIVKGLKPRNKKDREILESPWFDKEYLLKTYEIKGKYVKQYAELIPHAVITKDGKWYDKDDLNSWRKLVSSNSLDWPEAYYNLVWKNAKQDDYMTIIDYHI